MFRILLLIVVVFGLGWGAAFGAGVAYGRAGAGPSPAASVSRSDSAPAAPSGFGSAGSSGSGPATSSEDGPRGAMAGTMLGRGTIGVVEQAAADRLTLRGAGGQTTVLLQPDTAIRKATDASRADLRAGAMILISGQRDPSGNVAARSVLLLPPEFETSDRQRSASPRP